MLTWYFVKACTNTGMIDPRYGTISVLASSSNVAKALHAASCTRLLLSRIRRKSYIVGKGTVLLEVL